MRRVTYSNFKVEVRNWLMDKGYKWYTEYRNEILDSFNAPFKYKGLFYYGSLSAYPVPSLPADKWDAFEPYAIEFSQIDRELMHTKNHLTNYLNHCRNDADILALLPKQVIALMAEDIKIPVPITSRTVSPELVKSYSEIDLFQTLIDRIVILGDM